MAEADLATALVLAGVAALGGLCVPFLIRALPEPVRDESAADEDRKPLYAEVGATPGLGWRTALSSAVVGALIALAVPFEGWLLVLVPLIPVCVALAVIDWHTKLLPTRLVLPATGFALLGAVVVWAVTQQTDDLVRALIGLVVARSLFWALWFVHSAGMGFGDVRLAALLGVALGHLGWAELVVGLYAGFLVFGLPGLLLAIVRRDRSLLRTAFPFGPFLLVGAVVGIVAGPWAAGYLGLG